MLTLDQVKLLEDKVESLIAMVKSLYGERDALRDALQKKDKEIEELSEKVNAYEAEQTKIEERVVNALNQLDVFQSSVNHAKAILSQANIPADAHQDSFSQACQEGRDAETSDVSQTSNEEAISKEAQSDSEVAQTSQDYSTSAAQDMKQKDEGEEDPDKQMDIF